MLKLKKFKKITFWLVFLTLYFNIGWGLGYYYHSNVFTQKFEAASWHAKLMGGHCAFLKDGALGAEKGGNTGKKLAADEFVLSISWPFYLIGSLISWVVHVVFWILKFIFVGGLFKLVFGIS